MVARRRDGSLASFPVVETIHDRSILLVVEAPAPVPQDVRQRATALAEQAVACLDGESFRSVLYIAPHSTCLAIALWMGCPAGLWGIAVMSNPQVLVLQQLVSWAQSFSNTPLPPQPPCHLDNLQARKVPGCATASFWSSVSRSLRECSAVSGGSSFFMARFYPCAAKENSKRKTKNCRKISQKNLLGSRCLSRFWRCNATADGNGSGVWCSQLSRQPIPLWSSCICLSRPTSWQNRHMPASCANTYW